MAFDKTTLSIPKRRSTLSALYCNAKGCLAQCLFALYRKLARFYTITIQPNLNLNGLAFQTGYGVTSEECFILLFPLLSCREIQFKVKDTVQETPEFKISSVATST